MNGLIYNLGGVDLTAKKANAVLMNIAGRELFSELHTRHPELAGPVANTIETEILSPSERKWDLKGATSGSLVDELYRRFPNLIGPLKDEIEERNLLDQRRE